MRDDIQPSVSFTAIKYMNASLYVLPSLSWYKSKLYSILDDVSFVKSRCVLFSVVSYYIMLYYTMLCCVESYCFVL